MSELKAYHGGPGRYLYAIGQYRAAIVGHGREWRWRVWDVIDKSLGGSGHNDHGAATTCREATQAAVNMLQRRATGGER